MYNEQEQTCEPPVLRYALTEQVECKRLSLRETTARDLARARAEVTRLEELAQLLNANPTVNRILELLGSKY
jgi:hypothetical protein